MNAQTAAYYYTRTLDASLSEAEARVRDALAEEGFGVLTEIDVQATLKKKLDVDFRPYKILGACNPPTAHRALQAEPLIGTMLPCNVILHDAGDGQTEIAAVDPIASMSAVENDALGEIATEIRDRDPRPRSATVCAGPSMPPDRHRVAAHADLSRLNLPRPLMDRRHFLQQTALAGAAVLVGCRPDASAPPRNAPTAPVSVPGAPSYEAAREAAASAGPARQVRLVAEEIDVEVGPGEVWRTWGYNGQYPGPEIRLREGERLEATVVNRLPADTTIHWHGLPVPNPMDGVPGLTQEPIPPGGEFVYAFAAEPAGSYLYHSHIGLQLDRGLIAPLIVEEREPHVAYDREVTLVLDDYLPGTPEPLADSSAGGGRGGMMGQGRRGGGVGGMMGGQVPPYAGLLINGRLPSDPVVVEVRRGERLRMRVMNPSGATTFRFAVGGHRLTVTHADGYPVRPVTVDALLVSMGERYDVVLEADNPGAWPIAAATVEGDSAPAQAVLRYRDAAAARSPAGALPDGLGSGRLLRLDDLRGVEDAPAPARPDRTFDLTLSGGMMSSSWTIDGQAYPDAAPLEIHEGERVRVTMFNRSPMIHPMHLHGHFFRTGDLRSGGVRKDTVLVPAHMGRAAFEFVADNPGRWFFHCHNVYHLEAGMAREVRYV